MRTQSLYYRPRVELFTTFLPNPNEAEICMAIGRQGATAAA